MNEEVLVRQLKEGFSSGQGRQAFVYVVACEVLDIDGRLANHSFNDTLVLLGYFPRVNQAEAIVGRKVKLISWHPKPSSEGKLTDRQNAFWRDFKRTTILYEISPQKLPGNEIEIE